MGLDGPGTMLEGSLREMSCWGGLGDFLRFIFKNCFILAEVKR